LYRIVVSLVSSQTALHFIYL